MTELERAREHLRICQAELHRARCSKVTKGVTLDAIGQGAVGLKFANSFGVPLSIITSTDARVGLNPWKNAVLAALSWVWDAQERGAKLYFLSVDGALIRADNLSEAA